MNKKILLLLIILLIIGVFSYGYIISNLFNKNVSEVYISYTYKAIITTPEHFSFEVYLPIIISDNGTNIPAAELDQLSIINGDAKVDIITTQYGPAIKIESNNSMAMEYSYNFKVKLGNPYNHYLLSMENTTDIDWTGDTQYWAFYSSSGSNNSIDIVIDFDHVTLSSRSSWHTYIDISTTIKDGWNLINATKRTICSD